MELRLEEFLYLLISVRHISDDALVCSNEGTGDGVEVWSNVSGGFHSPSSIRYDDF